MKISKKNLQYLIESLLNEDQRGDEQEQRAKDFSEQSKNVSMEEQIKKAGLEGQVTEMTSEEISNIKEEGFDSKTAAGEFGFIKQATDGSFEIILNKDKPMVGTAAHEFMHAVLFKTIKGNTKIQTANGKY